MDYVNDIMLDDTFDLAIDKGDFIVGESDEQHLQLITLLEPGQIRHSPLTGLGMYKKLQGPLGPREQDQIRKDLYDQLQFDGYRQNTGSISFDGEMIIKAER